VTVRVFGYLILISIDLYDFIFPFSQYVLVLMAEIIYQTLNHVFDHISKYLKFSQNYTPIHCIFNSLVSVLKCVQT